MSENNFIARPALAVYNNGDNGGTGAVAGYFVVGHYPPVGNKNAIYVYDAETLGEVKIVPSDVVSDDYFGQAVAIGNNKFYSSSYRDDDTGTDNGAIYYFNADGTGETKIVADSPATNFGKYFVVNQSALVTVADNQYPSYIWFMQPDGSSQTRINAPTVNLELGRDMSLSSNKVYINDYRGNTVFVYGHDGVQQSTITASDGVSGDQFGFSTATSEADNLLVISARRTTLNGFSGSGSVYLYDLDGLNEVRIDGPEPEVNQYFGWSVAVGDGKIAIGAPGFGLTVGGSGAVYVCDLDGSNMVRITPSSAAPAFARNVEIIDNKLIVSSGDDNETSSLSGAVYVYNLDGTGETKIKSTDVTATSRFGFSTGSGSIS